MAELKIDQSRASQGHQLGKRARRRSAPDISAGEAHPRACPAGLKYSRVVGLVAPPRVKPPAATGASEGRRIKKKPALTALEQEAGMTRASLGAAPAVPPPVAGNLPPGLKYSSVMGLTALPRVKPPLPAAYGEGKRVKKSLALASGDAEAMPDRLQPEAE